MIKKLFSLFAAVLFAGSMMAADPVEVTINFGTTTGYWKAHENDSYTDSDGRVWTRACSVSNMSGQAGYSQFGNASNTPKSLTFTATAGKKMTVSVFSVTMAGASAGSSPSTGTIYLYRKPSSGDPIQLATASVNGTGNVNCAITENASFASTDQLQVYYAGSNKAVRISKLEYKYVEDVCSSSITIEKASVAPEHGSFKLSNEGEICIDGGNVSTTVTATPDTHYHLSKVTASVGTVGAISGNTCEITEIGEDAVISVEFAEDDKFTVTWSVNGVTSTSQVYDGDQPEFPATPAAFDEKCTTFYGWATESWETKLDNLSGKTVYRKAAMMPAVEGDVTYYAVFAKAKEGSVPLNTIVFNEEFTDFADEAIPTSPSASAETYEQTITYVCTNGGTTTKIYANGTMYAGGEAPELLVSKSNGSFAISGISTANALSLEVTYNTNNQNITLTTSENVSAGEIAYNSTSKIATATIDVTSGETFDLTFYNGEGGNSRLDNINIKVSAIQLSDFITKAQGGGTAVDNTEVNGKAVKTIVNGQLVIEKNGVRYNAMGQVIR